MTNGVSNVAQAAPVSRASTTPFLRTLVAPRARGKAVPFIIGLPKKVRYSAYALSNPNRVVVDLPAMAIDLPLASAFKSSPLIGRFHYGLLYEGKARLIIETKKPVRVSAKFGPGPGGRGADLKLNIVAKPAGKSAFTRKPRRLGGPALNRLAKEDRPLIVVDAGHGGHDTGAVKNGIREKDMVLAFALKLRDRLLKSGKYRVKMTRDRDVFVKLRRRAQIARKARADLFISVHADYVPAKWKNVRGATFYTLKRSTASKLARSAPKKVNVASVRRNGKTSDSAVMNILSDLETRWVKGTKKRSEIFAAALREYMGDATKLRPTPHRTANFAVLKSASVPSVLIELAYVSNKQDAKLLKSNSWRSKTTEALVKAVDNYFSDSTVRLPF
ncbi:MAG: N-acetylmuramoyl-L-alanine amidase [Pseudomonadota bacterium]